MPVPLAYHITWTSYGTWLYGDSRGWIESGVPGVQPPDEGRLHKAQLSLARPPVTFDEGQRALIEEVIKEHCRIRGWVVHALNARSNHVHVVMTADPEPEEVMNQLKAWCSRRLSDAAGSRDSAPAGKAGRRKWFTEHGSTKWINGGTYLENAIRYVRDGQ